nr:MAG TPA: hypothetical protein [Caudoviricetes sp.]
MYKQGQTISIANHLQCTPISGIVVEVSSYLLV